MSNKIIITDSPAAPAALRGPTNRQWNAEAIDTAGNVLFCRVTYNHSTRGTWEAALVKPDGTFERLSRVPNIRTARWPKVTLIGQCVIEDGRA